MNNKCVVNFGDGCFARGKERIEKSFRENGFDGDFMFFQDVAELPGCPSHKEVPYAFKPYALNKAAEKGYRYLLWVDSSVYAVRPVDRIFGIIQNLGYMFLLNGWTTGEWCSDAALKTLDITREESFGYRHIMACSMGLDMMDRTAREFLDKYYEKANDGITFKGAWSNKNHEVSNDDRVLGHRHDQTAASVIATKLGMTKWQEHLLMYNEGGNAERPESIILELKHL